MTVQIDICINDHRWESVDIFKISKEVASALFDDLELIYDWQISILACDDMKIQHLNKIYRNKDNSTNVLSWPAFDLTSDYRGGNPKSPQPTGYDEDSLGDIAISFDTCQKESDAFGLIFRDHVAHLLLHGYLHLLGYTHEDDFDAQLMEGYEKRILDKMGIADPYKGYND